MKIHNLAAAFVLTISTATFAADAPKAKAPDPMETLFVDGNCNNCHTVDHKTVGPSLLEIAAKYKGDKEAQTKLEQKVRSGGKGVWGVVPMPGTRASITDENIKMLVTWVLSQKEKPKEEPKPVAKPDQKAK